MDTVYTILTQSGAIADSLELDSLVLVMDQDIYSKAQQIWWQNDSFKERLVIRLGDFPTFRAYLGTIGKRFQDSGLEDILIEADIVAPGSMKGILSGHYYNRSIRANKMMYEAIVRLRWKALLETSSADECDSALDFTKELNEVRPTMKLFDITQQDRFTAILTMYQSFIERESLDNPTFDYWSSYIDMVQGLLLLL